MSLLSPYNTFKWYVVGRTVLLAILTAFIYLIATLLLKDQVSFLMTDMIKTMAKVSVLVILAVEIWDRYSDRLELFQRMSTYSFNYHAPTYNPAGTLMKYGVVIVVAIAIVGIFAGGYTLPVVLIGIFIGSYVALPATGSDYWVLVAWIACAVMALVTGLMTINELIEYQTFTELLGGFS